MPKDFTLHEMYVEHLKDMYSAENQIVKALPKIIKTATSPELKHALTQHLTETEGHVARLQEVFQSLEGSPRGKKCLGMEGLLAEGKEAMAQEGAAPDLMDAALIGGCQKVEHYEMCGYKDLIRMAGLLGDNTAVDLLTESLDEEEAADQKLAALSENVLTPEAVHVGQVL